MKNSWFSNTKVVVSNLDIHFTHLCNLHCDQCTHLSNYGINKQISIEELKNYFSLWNQKIQPEILTISGGEPFLHKDAEVMIDQCRKFWPKSFIRIFSNGLLLHKFPDLPKLLKDLDINLTISNHHTSNSKVYDKKFNDVLVLLKNWIKTHQIESLIKIDGYTNKHNKIIFRKEKNELFVYEMNFDSPSWLKFYNGYGKDMMPFNDNDIKSSWNNCPVHQTCFQLLNGKIYKCAPLAYLPMLQEKFGLSSEWHHYLSYKPLSADSNINEIREFFNRQEESYCNMCPSKPISFLPSNNPMKIFNLRMIT